MVELTVARALSARIAHRSIRIATFVIVGIFVALLLIVWTLAYFFSAWWWLLLVPFVLILGILFIVRLLVMLFVNRIYPERLSPVQKEGLDDFVDKIQQLLEARATPPIFFVFISLKDIVLHRDIRTVDKLVRDSVGLKRDYRHLNTLFN